MLLQFGCAFDVYSDLLKYQAFGFKCGEFAEFLAGFVFTHYVSYVLGENSLFCVAKGRYDEQCSNCQMNVFMLHFSVCFVFDLRFKDIKRTHSAE